MRAITVCNLKGGTGKTTITISLGAALAAAGHRVLLIDTDPQGHVATSFRLNHSAGLWDLMVAGRTPEEVIHRVTDRIHVIPSDKRTAAVSQQFASLRGRASVLAQRLQGVVDYDFVLVDTPPALSVLLQNALVYTRGILIPVSMSYLALRGATQTLELARMMLEDVGVQYGSLGIAPTFVDRNQSKSTELLHHLESTFRRNGIRVFSPIRADVELTRAALKHKTILDHAPMSPAAQDFTQLARELTRA